MKKIYTVNITLDQEEFETKSAEEAIKQAEAMLKNASYSIEVVDIEDIDD